ncbi:uncharacterized protein MELLADRAFT_86782 [Melampsora larici-populina 98AG31]|uniref:SET domain-containing protein n=1 Tax=Melampsora larici-populina (strain 98AG31 / pathotype 3-4-7) TaxID=747676 RepID=F4R3E0_MELLP|nr:uncharacterized protein MELLADRAFT_86782 [Melampsora larici-populina 98AG31]EGG12613.1 hypothetical protein MELLADRAFT_86782 [Melampsora larici-populina 98AG31]
MIFRDRKFSGLKWMTRSMKVKCDEVTRRFLIDWKSVSSIQDEEIMSLDEFLWGWLNVNTRCLWFDLGLKDHDDNITLAPVIDMVNYTLSSKVKPICTPNTFSLYSSHPLNQFTSPSTKRLIISSQTSRSPTLHPTLSHRKGDEILFSYGSHSNLTLWSEYGFLIRPKFSNGWNSVEITREVLGLFEDDHDDGVQKLSVLKDSTYWKDYTIESNPIGPSYRTLTALRLLYCPSLKLSNWYEIINGEKDECSLNVEDQIKGTIEKICLKLIEEIDLSLVDRSDWWIGNEGEGLGGCVKELMVEEKWILEGCLKLMNESN